jgi:hypothetical protein
MTFPAASQPQRSAIMRYLSVMAAGNLVWEIAHVPLYTLWQTGTGGEIAYVVLHCTLGDVLIAATTLGLALALVGRGWPAHRVLPVTLLTIICAVAYTVFSEWLNISVRGAWAYRDIMPTLPPFGTGPTPVLQWIIVPALAFRFARCTRPPK